MRKKANFSKLSFIEFSMEFIIISASTRSGLSSFIIHRPKNENMKIMCEAKEECKNCLKSLQGQFIQ